MLTIIILAAGKGKRMHSQLSKVAQSVAGEPMLKRVYQVAQQLQPEQLIIVDGKDDENLHQVCPDPSIWWVCQSPARGTGDAVKQALSVLPREDHQVLILYGDVPFACPSQLRDLIERTGSEGFGLVTALPPNTGQLGRIIRDKDQRVQAIIEYVDATEAQRNIPEVFSGMMVASSKFLRQSLENLTPDNAQGEYYLTDILLEWLRLGHYVETCIMSPWWRAQGVNSMAEMADLERAFQYDRAQNLMAQGVKIYDPKRFDCRGQIEVGCDVRLDINVVFSGMVQLGNNVSIEQNVRLHNVSIGDGCCIKANTIIEDCQIKRDVIVGPFAYIRPGCKLADGSKVGAFVEMKKTSLGPGSKANHLSYLGDSEIGAGVNIGAGVITCNYDGSKKHQTIIKDHCFIGAGCQLVAPIVVEENVLLGAGTCARDNIAANTLAVFRPEIEYSLGWAGLAKYKARLKKEQVNV